MHSRPGGDEKLLLKTKILPPRPERSCNDVDLARDGQAGLLSDHCYSARVGVWTICSADIQCIYYGQGRKGNIARMHVKAVHVGRGRACCGP